MGTPLVKRLLAVLLLLAACAGPSFSYRDYERKAAHTADEAASVVGSAMLTVELANGRRATRAYLSVLLGEAESTLGAIQQTFEGVQPPDRHADRLRAELGEHLDGAADVLAALRIEVRRGHVDALAGIAEPLGGLHDALEKLAEEHR
jgi:hypothetical protein